MLMAEEERRAGGGRWYMELRFPFNFVVNLKLL